jgi:hypothetical protein
MITHNKVTHCIEGPCIINIIAAYSEIEFTDCATNDSVYIEGLEESNIQNAIARYVHNLARQDDSNSHLSWLKQLIMEAKNSIDLIEAKEKTS